MLDVIVKDDILQASLNEITEILGEERLASITIERAVIGLFFIGVKLSNGYGGVSYTPIKSIPGAVCCPSSASGFPIPGKIQGARVTNYVKDIHSQSAVRKSFAIAVLNALSHACLDAREPQNFVVEKGVDPLDVIDIPGDALVVVIGALVPYLRRFKKNKQPFLVLELDARALKEEEMPFFRHADQAREIIPQADVLITTGTTLINDTIHSLLSYCKREAQIVIVGPTSSMRPTPFFQRDVDVVGGVLVTKPDELLDTLSEGGSGYHFFGKTAEKVIYRPI
ncbi:Fis family transcriptional regulator [Ammoniphilus oxalaticus]|uniref:Fis family transcriptional regulator n=1 Tax=Ammoniphilus oxalaticus TaxID=66863 RepID=A0A419SNP8_9BACL|nr:DUF364 domain-containing protein [Ammoniphilus oxalaticus]RKD25849.1 Fis family transcriptional regulator [Ammoniphilus oxalaticus]